MSRIEFGLLGSYNSYKKSPFETYYMGGDGMSGYSTGYAEKLSAYADTRTVRSLHTAPRVMPTHVWHSNCVIPSCWVTPRSMVWASLKAVMHGPTPASSIPLQIKRSAGLGVRIFLPMVGLMGIDWAYGFDKVYGTKGGSQFHFILGQEF